jgi:5-methylcytosine-specific restriction enzyme subunit McrC
MESVKEASKIRIKNIFYILLYAWEKVEEKNFVDTEGEGLTNLRDLFAKVLTSGIMHLKRRGIDRGYVPHLELLSCIRGKIDFNNTLKSMSHIQGKIYCNYDEFSYNILHNQILKTTLQNLLNCENSDTGIKLDIGNRKDLYESYKLFRDVETIPLTKRTFGRVQLHSNNYFYDFLIKVCELIYDSFIPEKGSGRYRFHNFLENEEGMNEIFERFVRNFYKIEQTEFEVDTPKIEWNIKEKNANSKQYVPKMQTDIVLTSANRKIVIDTKFYSKTLQEQHNKKTIHSGNLYQMFAYLKNLEACGGELNKRCEGILLYPTIDEKEYDLKYDLQGHDFSVKTVNLNSDWSEINRRLLDILVPDRVNVKESQYSYS